MARQMRTVGLSNIRLRDNFPIFRASYALGAVDVASLTGVWMTDSAYLRIHRLAQRVDAGGVLR